VPEIFTVTPGRGRAGDAGVAIAGAGFAPASPFGNTIEVDGSTVFSIASQDETDIVFAIPSCYTTFGFCATDLWVMILVQRKDTNEWATFRWWSKASLATLQTDSRLTEKIPTGEDLDNPTNDFLAAATWNRLATFVEFLTQEVLTAKGSVFSRDADGIAEVLVGADGMELNRVPAGTGMPTGLKWNKPKRTWTMRWGRRIPAGSTASTMAVNAAADSGATGGNSLNHVMPTSGRLRFLTVNVEAVSGDTLDRVRVGYNDGFVTLHDSGTGLAIGVDDSYVVDLDEWRVGRELRVLVDKSGTSGAMDLTATITMEEEVRPAILATSLEDSIADAVAVTDSLAVILELGGEASDSIELEADSIELEMTYGLELADAADATDDLERIADGAREVADAIDIHDDGPGALVVEVTQ